MPAHTWPNSVAPLPDGGMVVTDMFDPKDPKAPDKMNAGENTGAVYEWHPHKGYALVPGSRMSGNNGIEVSRDGKWIYVAAWGNKAVVRLSRGGGAPVKAGYAASRFSRRQFALGARRPADRRRAERLGKAGVRLLPEP